MQDYISYDDSCTDQNWNTHQWGLGKKIIFSCYSDGSSGEGAFEQKLGNDTTDELVVKNQRYTDNRSDRNAEQICSQQFVVLIGSNEQVVEDLFDETKREDNRQKR